MRCWLTGLTGVTCRGACDIVERAFNYAWMQAGLSMEKAGQQLGDSLRVRIVPLHKALWDLKARPLRLPGSSAGYRELVLHNKPSAL